MTQVSSLQCHGLVGVLCLFCDVAPSHPVSEGLMIGMMYIEILSKFCSQDVDPPRSLRPGKGVGNQGKLYSELGLMLTAVSS